MKDQQKLAQIAYKAYGTTTDFKNFQGNPMPSWDILPLKIQEAWINAKLAGQKLLSGRLCASQAIVREINAG